MNIKDLEFFKKKLEKEKIILETELKSIGHKNSKIAGGWETGPSKMDADNADENEVADKLENFEENIVPSLNTSKPESIASMARVRRLMETYKAVLFINHDKSQTDKLKLLPAFYD